MSSTDFIAEGVASPTVPVVDDSNQAMLTEINAAIRAILGGAQEYQVGTRRVRRGELSTLRLMRNELLHAIAEDTGCNVAVAYFDRR